MPTGYTAYIEDGEITTGKDFLKLCTRAFGIAVDQKDEPLSVPTQTKFKPNNYYKERYDKALIALERAKQITFDEAKTQMRLAYEKRIADYKRYADKEISMNKKYEKVRKEVEAWEPPTDKHSGLKKFALEQIDMCVTKQKYIDEYIEKSKELFDGSDDVVHEYILDNIERCQIDADRAYKSWQEELERVESKNKWMQQFLDSLK